MTVAQLQNELKGHVTAENETNDNVDTCCLNTNFVVSSYTGQTADIYPYNKSYAPLMNVPVVTGTTAYDNKESGATYILLFHKSLYYGTMLNCSLINPNQILANGINYWDNPFDKTNPIGILVMEELFIPLTLQGTKLSFQTRSPMAIELDNCPRVSMTSVNQWNPVKVILGSMDVPRKQEFQVQELVTEGPMKCIFAYGNPDSNTAYLHQILSALANLKERIISQVNTGCSLDPIDQDPNDTVGAYIVSVVK